MPKHVVWFKEVSKKDIPEVGGKGANLGELTQAGINVPEGFIATAQSFFYFLDKILKNIDPNNSDVLLAKSKELKEIIYNASIPPDIEKEILASYKKLATLENPIPPVAVRSSATAEDLPEASFAGQQATFLNVFGDFESGQPLGLYSGLFVNGTAHNGMEVGAGCLSALRDVSPLRDETGSVEREVSLAQFLDQQATQIRDPRELIPRNHEIADSQFTGELEDSERSVIADVSAFAGQKFRVGHNPAGNYLKTCVEAGFSPGFLGGRSGKGK